MPLLRAMTPVRIECGVHFDTFESGSTGASSGFAAAADARAATVVRIPRTRTGCREDGWCPASAQRLSSIVDWRSVVIGGLVIYTNL